MPVISGSIAKPSLNVIILGDEGHGKTTLTAVLNKKTLNSSSTPTDPNFISRPYTFIDLPSQADYLQALFIEKEKASAAILVVSVSNDDKDNAVKNAQGHIELARCMGIDNLIFFLNKVELQTNPACLNLIKSEIAKPLINYNYPIDKTPIIEGSALMALNSEDAGGQGSSVINKLIEALESCSSAAESIKAKPFLMRIDDVATITGRGTVASGLIERGILKPNDEVQILGSKDTHSTVCPAIESFRKILDEGRAGEQIGALLRGTSKEEIIPGMWLAAPGSITAHKAFSAIIQILKSSDGSGAALLADTAYQFFFLEDGITSVCKLPVGVKMVEPGDIARAEITLPTSQHMEQGTHFQIRQGGRLFAVGIVTRIIE